MLVLPSLWTPTVNIIVEIDYMLGKYVFVIFLSLNVIRNFRGTCSSIKMLKGYMARASLGTPGLGSPGKSGEAHPRWVASLAQPFVISSSCIPACIHFKSVPVGRLNLVSTIETIASLIKLFNPNIHTSLLYLTTLPLATSSAEIISQQIFN